MSRVAVVLTLLLTTLTALAASSLDLDQAKRQGLVGETLEGYLAVVDQAEATPEARALVEDVNARRRAEYQRIARENDIDLAEVEAIAAKKAVDRTRPGGWVRLNGKWQQK